MNDYMQKCLWIKWNDYPWNYFRNYKVITTKCYLIIPNKSGLQGENVTICVRMESKVLKQSLALSSIFDEFFLTFPAYRNSTQI